MVKRVTLAFAVLLVAAVLTACGGPIPTPNDFPPPPTGWQTVQAGRPTATPFAPATPTAPPVGGAPSAPATRPPSITLARVERVEIRVLESFPVRVQAVARGHYPDGCTHIADVSQVRDGNRIIVTITTKRPPDAMCTMALTPFEEVVDVNVSGLRKGDYKVAVNAVEASFTLTQDNNTSTLPQPATPYPHLAWSDVEALILAGQATDIMQSHALEVTIRLKDGHTVVATEPRIDYVLELIRRCGSACANTRYATE